MTAIRPNLLKLAAPLAVFAALLAVLALVNRSPSVPGRADVSGSSSSSARARVDSLQQAIKAEPGNTEAYAELGDAYLQRARETADPSYYARARRAFDAALRRDPRSVTATIGAGTLANLRHDFRWGLRLGRRARRLAPGLARPDTVIADAQIELGRYAAAERTLQRLVDLKPSLGSYARVSYFRELTGDQPGAIEAMRLAASAGGAPESVAYVRTLLGDLELQRSVPAARRAYREALAAVPSYPQAEAGLARIQIARGRLDPAAARLRAVAAVLPTPTHLILLAEADLARGDRTAGRRDLAVVRAQQRLLRSAGAVPDAETVLFEANHGDPRAGVRLGRRVWRSAPSIRSADALGWALTRSGRPSEGLAWSERALSLGSRDPLFRFHAGAAAAVAGRPGAARRDLRLALAGRAALPPGATDRVRSLLERLR
jgi:tetratricopeptide (TPR) repeat protein